MSGRCLSMGRCLRLPKVALPTSTLTSLVSDSGRGESGPSDSALNWNEVMRLIS